MKIPEGFRLAEANEVIQLGWKRGRVSSDYCASVPSSYIGKTLNQLINSGDTTSQRVIFALIDPGWPKFEGWTAIGVDAPCQEGDRAIVVKDVPFKTSFNTTPDKGLGRDSMPIGISFREKYKMDKGVRDGCWCVYRPNNFSPPSRLPPNPERLTRPLPLP